MRRIYRTLTVAGMLAVFSLSALVPAFAGKEGRKNTALLLTAATAYSVLQKNDRTALIGGLASAQAWKNYEDARKRESRQKAYKSKCYRKHHRGHAYGHYKHRRCR